MERFNGVGSAIGKSFLIVACLFSVSTLSGCQDDGRGYVTVPAPSLQSSVSSTDKAQVQSAIDSFVTAVKAGDFKGASRHMVPGKSVNKNDSGLLATLPGSSNWVYEDIRNTGKNGDFLARVHFTASDGSIYFTNVALTRHMLISMFRTPILPAKPVAGGKPMGTPPKRK